MGAALRKRCSSSRPVRPISSALPGSLTAPICFGNHVAGQRAISGAPRIRHFRRPAILQALLQRPQQRGADHRIVLGLRTVADMPLCQCAGGRQTLFEIAKTFHHPGQHCHQLAALEKGLADGWTPEVADAWGTAYGTLSGYMIS